MAPTSNIRVSVKDYYISYRAPDATTPPSVAEYEQIRALTNSYFEQYFANQFANDPSLTFIGVNSVLMTTSFGLDANIPSQGFNIYMQYRVSTFVYSHGSTPPNADETLAIMKSAITADYILGVPKMMVGTPFESTTEVFLSTIPAP
jgi:hypothetical protein